MFPKHSSSEFFDKAKFKRGFEYLFCEDILWDLEKLTEDSPQSLVYGPVYFGENNLGEKLRISSYFQTKQKNLSGNSFDNYYLVCSDSQGVTLGYRAMELKPRNGFIQATGKIRVDNKGQGYAVPIEIASMDILNRESTRIRLPIDWMISNANLEVLDSLRRKTIFTDEKILEKEQEQERWQAVYGSLGFVGASLNPADGYYHRSFTPKSGEAEIRNIKAVLFTRVTGSHNYETQVQLFEGEEEKELELKKRNLFLESLIQTEGKYGKI
jgi:hypothetical protein